MSDVHSFIKKINTHKFWTNHKTAGSIFRKLLIIIKNNVSYTNTAVPTNTQHKIECQGSFNIQYQYGIMIVGNKTVPKLSFGVIYNENKDNYTWFDHFTHLSMNCYSSFKLLFLCHKFHWQKYERLTFIIFTIIIMTHESNYNNCTSVLTRTHKKRNPKTTGQDSVTQGLECWSIKW